jgi:hypothetical protein
LSSKENLMNAVDTASPNEFVRYFSLTLHALVSCRDDGTVHVQRLGEPWTLHSSKRPEIGLADWMAARRVCAHVQPAWAREVRELPSLPEIADMITDGVCRTPTEHDVEPDGTGPDGVPSWLRCLGLL